MGPSIISPSKFIILPSSEMVRVHLSLMIFKLGKLSKVIPKKRNGLSNPCLASGIDINSIFSSSLLNFL